LPPSRSRLSLGGIDLHEDLHPVSAVTTDKKGKLIRGACCMLSNDEGTQHVSAPGSVTIGRNADAPTVICTKDGHSAGTVTVDSGVKNMAFGNILFGGIIGADADAGTEAAFDYPRPPCR